MARMTGLTKYALVVRAVELMWSKCFSNDYVPGDKDALMRAALKETLAEKMKLLEALKK